jgi:predicted aldo/keto reductase-like oxidoreductase
MKRRTFLKVVGGVAATGYSASLNHLIGADEWTEKTAETVQGMPRRVLGRTGQKISMVGFAGLALNQYDQARGTEGLHRAFDRGINYFDVAPAYGNGDCEIKMGIGLQGLDRDKIFLACKTKKRDKEGAREELERSLTRLKTDHFDLYQMPHLVTVAEVQKALGPGGAIETFLKAKEEGKIKYFGFSAHTTKAALEALKGFRFDTVMFPINFVEYLNRGFGREVLDLANDRGAAVLAIKPLSYGAWPKEAKHTREWWYRCTETQEEVNLGLRFAWSQKGVVAGIPPSFLDLLDKAIEAAHTPHPITEAELAILRQKANGCGSIFEAEEARAATAQYLRRSAYPDNPVKGCAHEWV